MKKLILISISFITIYINCLNAQPPDAAFIANITFGCGQLMVNFIDLSTNNPTSWLWDFGNGNTSALQNPSVVYINPASYTVTLIVSNADGSDTETKVDYINVYENPTADFTTDITSGCKDLTVQFINLSYPVSSTIISWYWDFGDGNNAFISEPAHTYSSAGSYNVSLTVTDANGCNNTFVMLVDSVKELPQAGFTGAPVTECSIPTTIDFGNLSSQGTAVITSWYWDFGDGNTSTAENPSHTYTTFDTFYVMLVVTDADACSDTVIEEVRIVDFQAEYNYTVSCNNDSTFSIAFNDLSTPAATTWFWDFGDGYTSVLKNPNHTYNIDSSYTITLIASINPVCIDTATKMYGSPKALFIPNQNYFCESPFLVNFDNFSTGTDSLFYYWDFGDGGTSSTQSPSHLYSVPEPVLWDTFLVSLVVSNGFGCKDTVSDTVAIVKPFALFEAEPDSGGCIPLDVKFTGISISYDTTDSWFWDFGDGSPFLADTNPIHTYIDTGHYSVTLIITSKMGCNDTLTKVNYVKSGIPPDFIDFTWLPPDTVCFHNKICFYDLSGFNDTTIHVNNWFWGFYTSLFDGYGEEHNSTEQNPCHDSGHWPIGEDTLQFVAGYNGCNDTIYKPMVIVPPVGFAGKLDQDTLPDYLFASCSPPITFGFYSNCYLCDSILTFQITNLQTGIITPLDIVDTTFITFNKAGKYQLFIEVKNDTVKNGGCYESQGHHILTIDSVRSGFKTISESACFPDNAFTFTDTSVSFYGEIVQWSWDFGDGDTLRNDTIQEIIYYDTLQYALQGSDTVRLFHSHEGRTSGTYRSPMHSYQDTGTYIVRSVITVYVLYQCCGLNIWDTLKCYYETIDTIRVHNVYTNFGADIFTGCAPLTVNFSDSSFSTSPIAEWIWNFGDGGPVDTMQNPVHTYSTRGLYNVELKITDGYGCTDSVQKNNYVNPTFPYLGFIYNKPAACINEDIVFTNTSTGTGLTFLWEFGDANTDNTTNPSHSYLDSGTYTIALTATDINGCDSTFSQVINIIPFPTTDFNADTFVTNCPPLIINFTDMSIAINDSIVNWFWYFGDGATSNVQNPVHTYSTPGAFDVTLIATNSTGCQDTLIDSLLIKLGGPFGSYIFSPTSGCTPLEVVFNASVENTIKYQWDFGDGTIDTLNEDSVGHKYTEPGNPTPVLILTDSMGCSFPAISLSSTSITIDQPVASFVPDNKILCGIDTVLFLDYSYTQNIYTTIVSRHWDFGDGDTSILLNPTHFFVDTGTFIITETIVNTIGCTLTTSDTINVYMSSNLKIDILDLSGCFPAEVQFYDSSEYFSPVVIRSWNFGDGSAVTTNQNPIHTFEESGQYEIVLVVTRVDGCIDTVVNTINISDKICEFTIPNVFTPNDDGINDIFKVVGVSGIARLEAVIFNRWGQKIYEWSGPKGGWSGRTFAGVAVAPGVYFYIIKIQTLSESRERTFTGTVTLFR